ncbi:hypothetical protein F4802DRAFT_342005 [Xylaria palmicola]|nr:hypothetical protein F4802DRAFT_342005 [Xylaria palmicola]
MAEKPPSIADQLPASASIAASASARPAQTTTGPTTSSPLPRITIRFCTQCKWMLRAAYFAQELLSTFSTSLGEVALQPATGGVFVVEIYATDSDSDPDPASATATVQRRVLWDRKRDGGFPETKELKRRVRDVIEPQRNLGHVDRDYPRPQPESVEGRGGSNEPAEGERPEAEQQQQQQQRQPPAPRWPQHNQPGSSQQTTANPQSEPSTDPNTLSGPQLHTTKDLGPYPRERTTDAEGPVYDPRMPGGGNMPVILPVAPRSGSAPQGGSSQSRSRPEGTRQEVCEDCQ